LNKALGYQFIWSLCGLILGLACIVGGILLLNQGITGYTNWIINFLGLKSNVVGASPGVILFIVGLSIGWITRYKINIKRDIN
jgi:hypothetical protein